jgi:tetratricopeptide (TPR) repeat protein
MKRVFILNLLLILFQQLAGQTVNKDIETVNNMLAEASQLGPAEYDSALNLANKAFVLAIALDNDTLEEDILKTIGDIYAEAGNPKLSLEYFFKSLKKNDESSLKRPLSSQANFQVKLNSSIAFSYFALNLMRLAQDYMGRAFAIIDSMAPGIIPEINILKLYYNSGALLLEAGQNDSAGIFMRHVIELNRDINDSLIAGVVLMNLGVIFKNKGIRDSALFYLDRSLGIWERINDHQGLMSAYNNLADLYQESGNNKKSAEYYELALSLSDKLPSVRSRRISLKGLIQVYSDLGDLGKARRYQLALDSLEQSFFMPQISIKVTDLATQYEFDKQFRMAELAYQKNIQAQRLRIALISIMAALMLLVMIAVLQRLVIQRKKAQNESLRLAQLELERKNLLLKNEKLEIELDYKSKELTANMMYLIHKNQLLSEMAGRLKAMPVNLTDEARYKLTAIVRDLQRNADSEGWKEFEIRFKEVHPEFYKNLIDRFPRLSANEKKLASFLRLNMTTKDISSITFQSVESIKMARNRLRKKLGLSPGENLVTFLEKL